MSREPPPGIGISADVEQVVIGPVIALMIVSAVSVGLRNVSRLYANERIYLDDCFLFAALVVAWGTGVLVILACYKGIGKHIWDPTVQFETIIKIVWAFEYLYCFVILLTKLSIILFYDRLFPIPLFRKCLWVVLFLVVGWWFAILVVISFQCEPYSYLWVQYIDTTAVGRCINIPAFYIGNGAANVATNFIILLIPIPIVWNLQMPTIQRLRALCVFFLGGFVCVAGIIRIAVHSRAYQSKDLSWNMSQVFVWSSIEPNIGIVCACLPTFPPLLRRCMPRLFGSSMTPSPGPTYNINYPRQRSGTGDFYALDNLDNSRNIKSDDELILANDSMSCRRLQARDSTDDVITAGAGNSVMPSEI